MHDQRTRETEIPVQLTATLKWTDAQKQAWHELQPAALYLVGTACPVSGREHASNGRITKQWGGSFGVQLVRSGTSLAVPWVNTIQAGFSKGPVAAKLHWRLWCHDEGKVFLLTKILTEILKGAAVEAAPPGYFAIAHDHSTRSIMEEVKARARLIPLNFCTDDEGLRDYCSGIVRLADRRAARGRRG